MSDSGGLDKPSETAKPVTTKPVSAATYLEVQDDIGGTGMTYRMHISRVDYMMANFTEFDDALLHDIDHGKPSDTPMADLLLGLEMIVRRIEESWAKKWLTQRLIKTDSVTEPSQNATNNNHQGGV